MLSSKDLSASSWWQTTSHHGCKRGGSNIVCQFVPTAADGGVLRLGLDYAVLHADLEVIVSKGMKNHALIQASFC